MRARARPSPDRYTSVGDAGIVAPSDGNLEFESSDFLTGVPVEDPELHMPRARGLTRAGGELARPAYNVFWSLQSRSRDAGGLQCASAVCSTASARGLYARRSEQYNAYRP